MSVESPPVLVEALLLLGAVVVVVPLVQRLGLGSVPGYLIAGMLVGPSVLGLVPGHAEVAPIAEFGVVFLLFAIGIELSPARLWLMRRLVFGLGSAQLAGAAAAIGFAAHLLGVPPAAALVIGCGLALSSTALVLQVLAERRELATPQGRAALSVLLLQDVAVAPLVSLVYLLGDGAASGGASTVPGMLRSLALLVLFVVAGRWILRRALPLAAASRNPDILVATALLLVLGAGWLMHEAGFSMALGAFLAGVLLADSPFRHQVLADIHPFRGILLGLFFLAVGMSLDLRSALPDLPLLLAIALGMMLAKAALLAATARLFGLSAQEAVRLGAQLSQGGEFALVLFGLAGTLGVFGPGLQALLLKVVVLSLLLAPLAFRLGDRIAARFGAAPHPLLGSANLDPELEGHVVICGFGRVGSQLANLLEAAGRRWVATDMRADTVELARLAGMPVFYGDASRPGILRALRVGHAALVIVTLDDAEAAERCLHAIRQDAPRCPVVARSKDLAHARELQLHGAERAVPETTEYSLQLGLAALSRIGLDGEQLQALEDTLRADDYARLLGNRVGLPMRR